MSHVGTWSNIGYPYHGSPSSHCSTNFSGGIIGKAIGQSSFWSDAEKASFEDLLNYPMAEDASNYLNLSLFGPFEEHVLGVMMAIGLLTEQLTSCVKKVNFQRYAGTQSTTDALYTPASPCQNVTKIFETVGRIVAGRRMGVAENAFKAVTMPVFVEMVDERGNNQITLES